MYQYQIYKQKTRKIMINIQKFRSSIEFMNEQSPKEAYSFCFVDRKLTEFPSGKDVDFDQAQKLAISWIRNGLVAEEHIDSVYKAFSLIQIYTDRSKGTYITDLVTLEEILHYTPTPIRGQKADPNFGKFLRVGGEFEGQEVDMNEVVTYWQSKTYESLLNN